MGRLLVKFAGIVLIAALSAWSAAEEQDLSHAAAVAGSAERARDGIIQVGATPRMDPLSTGDLCVHTWP